MRDPEFQDNLDLPLQFDGKTARRPRSNVWKRLSRAMEVVIYVLLVLAVIKLFGPEWDRQDELEAEIERLSAIHEDKQAEVERLRQEHRLLKTDKEYLETVARDRLDLQHEDEYVVRIDRESDGGE